MLSIGNVVETTFSGTKTVHTVVALSSVYADLVKIAPRCPVHTMGDWMSTVHLKKVGGEVRELEDNDENLQGD
jgi:phosphoglycerate-specific signal transduction histidine kinase